MMHGEKITTKEATDVFFSVTKLFQSKDESLRRMVYLVLKELSKLSEDVIIAVAILTKDITSSNPVFRANAIRVISRIIDPGMLSQIERYLKTSIVDKDPYVSSSALVSTYHLFKKSPDIVRRWMNEIQEASHSRSFVQYHALGVLYAIRQHDPMAVTKLIHSFIKAPSKMSLTHCFLIRIASRILAQQPPERRDKVLLEYIYSCLRNGGDMVIFEAARQLTSLSGMTATELEPVVSALQIFLSSPKPTSRFAAIKTISKIATIQPAAIKSGCVTEMSNLLTDSNRFVSTLAATTLLQVEKESAIDKLLKQVSGFIEELSDDFKIQVVEGIRNLSKKFPSRGHIIMSTLSQILKKDGGLVYKRLIVDTFIEIIHRSPEYREKGLEYLSEYIEDCEFTNLSTRILHFLGEEGPTTSHPMTYIRSIYNRMILETEAVRASAVNSLAQYSQIEPEIVSTLLSQCTVDRDDQVRDKTTFYMNLINENQKNKNFELSQYLSPNIQVPIENLEESLKKYIENGQPNVEFDISTVSTEKKVREVPFDSKMGERQKGTPQRPSSSARQKQLKDQTSSRVQVLFQKLGKLLKSSKVIPLTEQEAEYQVSLIKHIFPEHVILEFIITNTIDDIAITNIQMDIEPSVEGWVIQNTVLCDTPIRAHETGMTYAIIPIPDDDIPRSTFSCIMKFDSMEVDPSTYEIIEESATPDEYPVDEFVL